jgi:predicted RNA-binding Zn ribbon-like protein
MKGQPGDRAEAPGQLALVQSFVNSVNREFGPDEFATTDGLAAWLDRNGFGGLPGAGELDRQEAVILREALRALLRENNGASPDPQARAALEHIARGCPLSVGFDTATSRLGLRPAVTDMRGVLAAVLASAVGSVADGSWERLKACSEHVCEWVFYDRSKNRGSKWCSMSVCGTRAKMRNYRQTKRANA